jgi:hypothetical protein
MKPPKKIFVTLLILPFVGCCGIFLWFLMSMTIFLHYQTASIPKFDALNDNELNSIPAPEGVELIEQSRLGIDNNPLIHGRYLIVRYEMVNIKSNDVIQYYNKFLLSEGWVNQFSNPSGNYYYYSKNTACIDLDIYGDEYSLYIWHDFWKQDFSPPVVPNLEIDNALSLGYSSYVKCPR